MANTYEPMIKLEPGGKAPILSYNVPEPTSYSGRNFIDLQIDKASFRKDANIGVSTDGISIVTAAPSIRTVGDTPRGIHTVSSTSEPMSSTGWREAPAYHLVLPSMVLP